MMYSVVWHGAKQAAACSGPPKTRMSQGRAVSVPWLDSWKWGAVWFLLKVAFLTRREANEVKGETAHARIANDNMLGDQIP